MNYAPPLGRFGRLLSPATDHLESKIEEALRDFKRALESKTEGAITRSHRGPASAGWDEPTSQRATGTDGRALNPPGTPGTHMEDERGGVQIPGAVDYTRPPKDR